MDETFRIKPTPLNPGSWTLIKTSIQDDDESSSVETEILFTGTLCDCKAYMDLYKEGLIDIMQRPKGF